MTGMADEIVVGYDGSPGSAEAVRWAAREALARGTTLTVCLAWLPDHMELATESALSDLARQHGKEILARGLPYAQSVLGPARVHAALAGGPAAYVLCERSRAAQMVVVGCRGHSELPGTLQPADDGRGTGPPGRHGDPAGHGRRAAVSAADRRGRGADAHRGLPRPRRPRS